MVKEKVSVLAKGEWIVLDGTKYQILSIDQGWKVNEDVFDIWDHELNEGFYDDFDFIFHDPFKNDCVTLYLYNRKLGCLLYVKRRGKGMIFFHSDEGRVD